MIVRKVVVLSAVFAALGAFAGGCQSGGVGDPCTPEDEYQPAFSGFAASEVNVESRSFQCETRICLVNHFRGRVSCPLGQNSDLAKKAQAYSEAKITGSGAPADFKPTDPAGCRIPGSSGEQAEVVQVSVLPQCNTRQAKDSVYCSCRCDGPDPNAKYCECPDGFVCAGFPDFDLGAAVAKGSGNLRGKYCVKKSDTLFNEATQNVEGEKLGGKCANAVSAEALADKCTAKPANCDVTANP